MSFTMGMMPVERPRDGSYQSRSAQNSPMGSPLVSPAGSRRSSVSSMASATTEPGYDRSRQFSTTSSIDSTASSKSAFRSFFTKKEKKPKDKKEREKIVLTSKYAAAVKTKMMMDEKERSKAKVKTAGVVGIVHTGHMTAAQQEARHPHSGPPALHAKDELPALTRIISADEPDEEDEYERNERLRLEWELSKQSGFAKVTEQDSDESAQASAEVSADEDEARAGAGKRSPSDGCERTTNLRRPLPTTKSSFGGRYHRDEKGAWRR